MSNQEMIRDVQNGLISVTRQRPAPFGVVFAYSLAGNSLDSLCENIHEWESENKREHWPNFICVLEEGLIYHNVPGMTSSHSLDNLSLLNANGVHKIEYKNDSLFYFYMHLIDLCNRMQLGPLSLSDYFDPFEKVGSYVVRNHNKFRKPGLDKSFKLSNAFIDKMVTWCRQSGPVKFSTIAAKALGRIDVSAIEESTLENTVYYYDPENLPPLDLNELIIDEHGRTVAPERTAAPWHVIEVDGRSYYFPIAYLVEEDLEEA
jgi:hypothetical protein